MKKEVSLTLSGEALENVRRAAKIACVSAETIIEHWEATLEGWFAEYDENDSKAAICELIGCLDYPDNQTLRKARYNARTLRARDESWLKKTMRGARQILRQRANEDDPFDDFAIYEDD